jgi:LysR family transcriptional regulator, cyn operon transcriptional activator
MELRHLRYFVTVADAGGFAQGAERLHITQPGLWRQIRDLESELGLRLFERVGRHVRLTADGDDLLNGGRDLLARIDAWVDRARALKSGRAGTLRVGATSMTVESVLAQFLTQWGRQHSEIEVRLTEDSGGHLLDRLERGELQFAITVAGDRRFRSRSLFPAGVLAVIPTAYQLKSRGAVEITDLAGQPLLLLRNDFISRRWFDAACEVAHVRPRVLLESGAPHTLTALASAGRGIAIVPTNVRVARAGVRIAPILLRGRPLGASMGISWDPRHFLPPYAENFIEELMASTKRSYPGKEFKLDRFGRAAR